MTLYVREWNIFRWFYVIFYKYVYKKAWPQKSKDLKYDNLFQSFACFLFVELFFTDLFFEGSIFTIIFTGSIFTEYSSLIFSLALPKLPPNFLMRESDKIKPAMLSDCSEQIVFHGVSIEMTFALPVL